MKTYEINGSYPLIFLDFLHTECTFVHVPKYITNAMENLYNSREGGFAK